MNIKALLVGVLSSSLVLTAVPVRAEMIGSAQLVAPAAAAAQRAKVDAFLARADVQQKLVELGVAPEDAATRVAGLTQSELEAVAGHVDSLPAGAGAVELVLIVVLVLIILELLGAINIFTRI